MVANHRDVWIDRWNDETPARRAVLLLSWVLKIEAAIANTYAGFR